MPRTFKATLALVATLICLVLITVIAMVQNHQMSSQLVEVNQGLNEVNRTMTAISRQIERGGLVSGGQGSAAASGDKYAEALNDPNNILEAPQDQLIHPDATPGGTLRRLLANDPAGFNWLIENSVDVAEIQFYVHETFARQDFEEPDNYVPYLAYKVEANDDFTEYVVHLREGVYWQTPNVDMGDPRYEWLRERRELTAEDAVFYFEMAQSPEVQAAHIANYVADIDTVEAIDRYTFRVTWDKPRYHSLFTVMLGYPLPKWLYSRDRDGNEYDEDMIAVEFNDHWSNDYPVGTGPYTFDSFRAGDRVALELNEDYWGDLPPIENIEYHIIPDPEAGWNQTLGNDIDFLPALAPPRYRSEVLQGGSNSPFEEGDLKYEVIDRFAYHYIGWNADNKLFEDRKVRKAMTLAFNREGIIENTMHGLGELQSGPFYYDHPANDPDIEPLPFDLDRAGELLDEAGWTDTTGDGIRNKEIDGEMHRFEFTLTAYNRPAVRSWTSIFAEDLRRIGIRMTSDPVDWALMQRRMEEKQFDAFTGGWGLSWFNDPYQIWHSSQADIPRGSNRVGFRNDEADEIIDTLRETFDTDERIRLLREFHAIVHHEQPYTFFYAPKDVAVWNPRLENVVFQQIRPQTYSLPWYITE